MLIQFSTQNFKSFKDEAILSMLTAEDDVLSTVAMYGANAAGKSNFFQAMSAAIIAIRQSNMRQVGDVMPYIKPFKFANDTNAMPSSFEFVFVVDGVKYVYGFRATRDKIISEYLYKYVAEKLIVVFEREENDYEFTVPAIKKELQPIIERNTENKLFLATAAAWNSKELAMPYRWFLKIDTYDSLNYRDLLPRATAVLENDDNDKIRKFIIKLLHAADINISDYNVKVKETKVDDILKNIPSLLVPPVLTTNLASSQKSYQIAMQHEIMSSVGKPMIYEMPLNEESKGTQSIFLLGPLLQQAFKDGRILCIDEFDNNLHPLLVAYIIGLFNNATVNTGKAQLIISTHATELLNIVGFKDEQVYFVEKNNLSGESTLYSADEFDLPSKFDIHKAYMLGRLGALPDISEGENYE